MISRITREWLRSFSDEELALDPAAGAFRFEPFSIINPSVTQNVVDVEPIRANTRGKGTAKTVRGVI